MSPAGALCGSGSFQDAWRRTVASRWFLVRRTRGCLTNGVCQCQEVVRAGLRWMRWHSQSQYFPASGHSQRSGVLLAKIVTMRLSVGGQRAQDSGRVCIDVRQSGYRGLAAG